MNFNVLPNLIALAILVAVFWAILRKGTTERLHLWLAGWILVLVHFAANFPVVRQGTWSRIIDAVSLDCLLLAGIAFLVSVSIVASNARRQALLSAVIAIPTLAFINSSVWEVSNHGYYYALIAVGLVAPCALFCVYYGRVTWYALGVFAASAVVAASVAWSVAKGSPDVGIDFILAGVYFCAAGLFWRRYRRGTAGVLTTVIGFVLWGAVFPTGVLLFFFAPNAKVESEVWNIPKYLVAVGMILILLEDQIETSKYLAYHDDLTGLPNRRLLDDRLERALALAERGRSKVAVLLLDLNRFKEVNDNFGHRVGDLALREVVSRLTGRIRASDTLARSGGDEFTVVASVADAQEAAALGCALESAVSAPMYVEGQAMHIGLSVGVALFPDDGRNPDRLHAAADQAMYAAKRASRGGTFEGKPQPPAACDKWHRA
jgi:diguanylate cyclase (GGDEF)-like protein